ncbi:hypothetical protein JNUCC42_03655 [Brevibacterium sp. JNUCC-42]|nr:hypothetical protein JNUCC42_03655 [Brevibacterium sp. JNUCC-42]
MKHLEFCEQHTKEANEKRADYDRHHPNHCKECEDWGYVYGYYEHFGYGKESCGFCILADFASKKVSVLNVVQHSRWMKMIAM